MLLWCRYLRAVVCWLRDEKGVTMNNLTHSQNGFAFPWAYLFSRKVKCCFGDARVVGFFCVYILP